MELKLLSTWLRARDCATSPAPANDIPDDHVDGFLRLHGAHNYGIEVYVPGGERDRLEISDIKRELAACRYPLSGSGAAGTGQLK